MFEHLVFGRIELPMHNVQAAFRAGGIDLKRLDAEQRAEIDAQLRGVLNRLISNMVRNGAPTARELAARLRPGRPRGRPVKLAEQAPPTGENEPEPWKSAELEAAERYALHRAALRHLPASADALDARERRNMALEMLEKGADPEWLDRVCRASSRVAGWRR